MEKVKKITALFLTVALLLPLLPGAAWATETEEIPVEFVETTDTEDEPTEEEAPIEEEDADEGAAFEPAAEETEKADEEANVEDADNDEVSVVSEEDIATVSTVDSGTCGDNLTWKLNDSGTLTISGTGEMWDWDSDSDSEDRAPWYEYRESIQSVAIKSGVTNISGGAFELCE
ncbi:MAG: hypothetical protein LIO51_06535 [Clostridiales bacterium]|nr:hypothetical protein [Clostridiales bacterium]